MPFLNTFSINHQSYFYINSTSPYSTMIIKWVVLENIRSYTSEKVSFPLGSTLLSGDIGSGKSSILLAIEFALFGAKRGELSANSLLRAGAQSGSVELSIDLEGKEIIIMRTLRRSKDSIKQDAGHIIINNVKKDLTANELKAHILELLGYPKDTLTKSKDLIFRYTVYTPQEMMKAIILEDKETRLDTLRKVFGIDKYKRIQENSANYARQLRERSRELSGRIADLSSKKLDEENLKKDLQESSLQKSLLEPKIEIFEDDIKKLNVQSQKIEELRHEFAQKKKALELKQESLEKKTLDKNRTKAQIIVLEKDIEQKRLEISNICIVELNINPTEVELEIAKHESEINKISQEKLLNAEKISQSEKLIVQLKMSVEKKKQTITDNDKIKNSIQRLENQIKDKDTLTKKISDLQSKMELIKSAISENDALIKNSKTIMSSLESLDNCPLCRQDVSHEHKDKILSEENEKLSSRSSSVMHLKEKLGSLQKELIDLETKLQTILSAEKDVEKLHIMLKHLLEVESELFEEEKKYASLIDQARNLADEKDRLNSPQLEQQKNKLLSLKKTLDIARHNDKLLLQKKNLINILEEKQRMLPEFRQQLSTTNSDIATLNSELSEISVYMTKHKEIDDKYFKIKSIIDEKLKEERLLHIKLAEYNSKRNMQQEQLDRISKEIMEKERQKLTLEELNNFEYWLTEHFHSLMGVMEKHVMLNVYREFNELFQQWFYILIEGGMTCRLNEEFTPIIEQNGYELDVENLSGGEKTALALAYRLAINKVINDMNTEIRTRDLIILDEPTDGFSSEQLDKVRDVLEELKVKQVIIVSHEPKIESFVGNVVRVTKTDHESRIG